MNITGCAIESENQISTTDIRPGLKASDDIFRAVTFPIIQETGYCGKTRVVDTGPHLVKQLFKSIKPFPILGRAAVGIGAEYVACLVPQKVSLDSGSPRHGRRNRHYSRAQFLACLLPQILDSQQVAILPKHQRKGNAFYTGAQSGHLRIGVRNHAVVIIFQGLQYHARTSFEKRDGGLMIPFTMVALKKSGRILSAKSISSNI